MIIYHISWFAYNLCPSTCSASCCLSPVSLKICQYKPPEIWKDRSWPQPMIHLCLQRPKARQPFLPLAWQVTSASVFIHPSAQNCPKSPSPTWFQHDLEDLMPLRSQSVVEPTKAGASPCDRPQSRGFTRFLSKQLSSHRRFGTAMACLSWSMAPVSGLWRVLSHESCTLLCNDASMSEGATETCNVFARCSAIVKPNCIGKRNVAINYYQMASGSNKTSPLISYFTTRRNNIEILRNSKVGTPTHVYCMLLCI